MSEAIHAMPVKRRRHRSSQRKLLDNVLMILGTLAAMFVIAAFSIELIEYQPVQSQSVAMEGREEEVARARPSKWLPAKPEPRSPLEADTAIQWDNPKLIVE